MTKHEHERELLDSKGNVLYKVFYQKRIQKFTVLDQHDMTNIQDLSFEEYEKFREDNNLYTLNELGVK